MGDNPPKIKLKKSKQGDQYGLMSSERSLDTRTRAKTRELNTDVRSRGNPHYLRIFSSADSRWFNLKVGSSYGVGVSSAEELELGFRIWQVLVEHTGNGVITPSDLKQRARRWKDILLFFVVFQEFVVRGTVTHVHQLFDQLVVWTQD